QLIRSDGRSLSPQTEQPPTERERKLLDRIDKLEQRLAALEAKSASAVTTPAPSAKESPSAGQVIAAGVLPAASTAAGDSSSLPGFLQGTTLNGYLDGFYGYNFNNPVGRINLLRANDVLHNNFTLNQADLIVERAPEAGAGRRLGMRLDLMFGQNTETLQ